MYKGILRLSKLSYITASKGGKWCWVNSHHLVWLCFVTVRQATSRRGEQQARGRCFCHCTVWFFLSASSFPVPLLSICVLFFFLIFYFSHQMTRRKITENSNSRIAKRRKPGIVWFFFIFSIIFSFFSFCKIWPSEFLEICIYLELQMVEATWDRSCSLPHNFRVKKWRIKES